MKKHTLLVAGLSGLLAVPAAAKTQLSGYLEAEIRWFPQDAIFEEQDDLFGSAAAQIDAYWASEDESHSVRFKPFGRITTADGGNRDHADIRELYYTYAGSSWQMEVGINKVYWGVAESAHLVDIVNQTDVVEAFNGEEKLGQPMISLGFEQDWGNLDLYVLPYFRERKYSDGDERYQIGSPDTFVRIPIDYDKTVWESDKEEKNIDYAARWSHYFGDLDMAVSYFNGTNRDAVFIPASQNPQAITLWYEQLEQVGLEMQYVWEDWAFKLESTNKQLKSGDYNSAVAGFEYTMSDVNFTGIDIGLLMEYLWNDRGDVDISSATSEALGIPTLPEGTFILPGEFLSPFEHDLFLATRFTMNDVDSTDFLAGVIYDIDKGTSIATFEGGTRFGESLRVTMNVYLLTNVPKNPEDSSFYFTRRDDTVELKAQWYF